MQIVHTVAQVRRQVCDWKAAGLTVGFVPTMGNLHAGHLSLITTAREKADKVVASIFVNPTQFGPNEDFDTYPRTLDADATQLRAAGCDLIFAPSVEAMYPDNNLTWVDVDELGKHLCGANRPGHFRGVSTVVCKLLNIVGADIACFGEKDFQQLAVIRRMVKDLFIPVEIIGVATMREANGLAMSSRNGYLSADEKQQAALIHQVLQTIKQEIGAGERDYSALCSEHSQTLEKQGFKVDYLEVVDGEHLTPSPTLATTTSTWPSSHLIIAIAAKLGSTRLIDNVSLAV